jgi:hypothetical protein
LAIANKSSSLVFTLLIPKLEPDLFGLTKQGNALVLRSVTNYGDIPLNFISYGPPCFAKGSKILIRNKKTGKEEYVQVETLRKGDFVKTLNHGFVPIHMIGIREMYNATNDSHDERMLYKCSKEQYPELIEDLIITGHHSILVDSFKQGEREKTQEVLGDIYVTDKKYRLPACVDKRASPHKKEGFFTVYHFALENKDYYMNYGVFANGLLVETSSKRYLKEYSNNYVYIHLHSEHKNKCDLFQ